MKYSFKAYRIDRRNRKVVEIGRDATFSAENYLAAHSRAQRAASDLFCLVEDLGGKLTLLDKIKIRNAILRSVSKA